MTGAALDKAELLALVRYRLYEDDDRSYLQKGVAPGYVYIIAKERARNGNLEPLQKILADLTGDPDIAEFIAQPSRPPWPKHKRKDYARYKPFLEHAKRAQGDMVRRIREIIQEQTGKSYGIGELVIEIAAKVLECEPEEVRELIKRGY